jgi:hemerythrin-like metal-binding protein
MAFIEFDDRYRLGHPEIDEQHAKLFRAVNQLYDAMRAGHAREELDRILNFLRIYTVKHFATEERFMVESGYPGYGNHRVIHEKLAEQVHDLERRHQAGAVSLSLEVFNFLKDWLAVHISSEDRHLVEYLRTKGM